MKVLVTGGTGVVGQAVVTELLRNGHQVRLLSRNANEDAEQWGDGVEPLPASVSEKVKLQGCADGCDLVLHVAGIIAESPPEITFESVNVEGTRNVVTEAERAGVGRFIYVSSLGAERGESDYHKSKRSAEKIVEGFRGGWIILRPGNVYGPGDEVVSLLLKMVRTLPAIPVIAGGRDKFQPIWVTDLAKAIGVAVERTDLHGRTLELAGDEQTSAEDLLDRFAQLTDRSPARVPLPGFLASAGAALAGLVGVSLPINQSQLTMMREGNVVHAPEGNALTAVFGVKPTTLEEGLKMLADAQPEQLPEDGIGSLKRKQIWADIAGSRLTPEELFERFRRDFNEATPGVVDAEVEPDTRTDLEEGATLTMSLPLRGNIQVRVQELTPRKATLVTLAGHPLAGAVRFLCEQRGDIVRFEVQVYDRPATLPDWFAMRTIGESMQRGTWESLIERMVRESGGVSRGGVKHEEETLDEAQAELIEEWVRDLVMERKRGESEVGETPGQAGDRVLSRTAEKL
ncbi:MAG: NAD-dependent epimerase/dehydratase family protein [Gemmatimonadaceae bacterium]|nr:NAD-dependent epimerase/dehydratase family protein [Gemmatimonadaceae bacterium]MDQ3243977.1 NAD-dependent epimerase/dehydratase family protein [Gemmatimonadota bacterium]